MKWNEMKYKEKEEWSRKGNKAAFLELSMSLLRRKSLHKQKKKLLNYSAKIREMNIKRKQAN
jgi:hypothetical protein